MKRSRERGERGREREERQRKREECRTIDEREKIG